MNPLLEHFLSEARESLQGIGEKLMQLEKEPDSGELMTELFRLVHTLKGNSGLFDLPELTRVLHAGEDLMDAVRNGRVPYSLVLADRLLDATDFVGLLCDEVEKNGGIAAAHAGDSVRLADALRQLIAVTKESSAMVEESAPESLPLSPADDEPNLLLPLSDLPEETRMEAFRLAVKGEPLHWLAYSPVEECFFQGDDPLHQARLTPGIVWGSITARKPWPTLSQMDPYCCLLDFTLLSAASLRELEDYYRYVPDQVRIVSVPRRFLILPQGDPNGGPVYEDFVVDALELLHAGNMAGLTRAARSMLELSNPDLWLSSALRWLLLVIELEPDNMVLPEIILISLRTLTPPAWRELETAASAPCRDSKPPRPKSGTALLTPEVTALIAAQRDAEIKFGRRSEDACIGPKSIKVEQSKIDRLMNLIGEMVVAKNALPYLAGRAETVFGVRDLSREIKAQYAVINRIAEEMQDSIMQVRMMPVSFVFQRFPRLVRDTSNKLGKDVNLILEGEDTEADKNVIESLGDPLVHIVRNSLDHGIESPEIRRGLGKPAAGTIVIRATQESDRVVIEIRDDGKGIDPDVIKRKACEKGVIDRERMERLTDQEAVNLVFAAGFSTADVVSDLSGRGVGMDVVRTAVEKINGTIHLESRKGKGTRILLSLPLSMSITNVMIVESNDQIFGVPMESVVETVRMPRADIRSIKKSQTTVLRGRIVPLKPLNALLGQNVPPKANDDDEIAVLVVSLGGESVGIMVDDFRETVDIILKPMTGVLAGLSAYSGSALLGDGSVLMVLDIKEIIR